MAIYRGPGGPGDAVNDAASEVLLALAAKDAAIAAQVAAEAARDAAELAETNAETAETNAETAETNAETAATNAAASASAASTSATNAASSASSASTSATNAANSATAAQTAETNAETAETNAAASASAAATSASNAATSATNASNSATAAATSASNAATSESNAATSATNAANSASAASTSASNAATSETNAAASASAASTSASNAASSASAASTSASNAASSASAAATSASNAATSETNAANSASAAATSATNASNSASAAATSATNASNSASAAATSATNASNSATLAQDWATKTTGTVDGSEYSAKYYAQQAATYTPSQTGNSGKYLKTDGTNTSWDAIEINTADITGTLPIANGGTGATSQADARTSLGVTATGSDTTYAYRANNLSDLSSASTARTNLGLGTIATQDSTNVSITGGSISGITDLAVADGGTGASTASGARTNLGLAIGTDVQAYNANLQGASQGGINSFKNRIINGAMVIDQRNAGAEFTSTSSSDQYTLDRWAVASAQASKFKVQQVVDAPSGFYNSLKATVVSAYSPISTDFGFLVRTYVEGFNVADLGLGTANAQPFTVSFWVKASVTGTYAGGIKGSANTTSYFFTYTINAANTWEYKTISIPSYTAGSFGYTNGVGLSLLFALGVGSNFLTSAGTWQSTTNFWGVTGQVQWINNSTATWQITGVQLEVGSTATSFDYRPYGTELALCQRYCITYGGSQVYEHLANGSGITTSSTWGMVIFPVTMRATPSQTISGNWVVSDGVSNIAVTSWGLASSGAESSPKLVTLVAYTAGGITQFRPYQVFANNSTSSLAIYSAEL